MEPKNLALRIGKLIRTKKAQDVAVLDMNGVSGLCDYFVIASGESLKQINSFAKSIEEDLAKEGIKSTVKVSPNDESGWVALDYRSVIVHLFLKPKREFYALENLWSDTKRVRLPRGPSKKK
ncbi:MAG: ribosome silencing factor [Candidatus Omnitrophota bacterium]|nr:MAG: ribosome silencing factor [Candidatus Omnitrophota bacterium]